MDVRLTQIEQLQVGEKITGIISSKDNIFLMKKLLNLDDNAEIDKTTPTLISENENKKTIEQLTQVDELTQNHSKILSDQELQSLIDNFQMEPNHNSQDYLQNQQAISSRKQCELQLLRSIDKIVTKKWNNAMSFFPKIMEVQSLNDNLLDHSVELAVKYLRQVYNTERVSILNLNICHCQKLEKAFYEDPNTLVISIHRYDQGKFYPGSGDPVKRGGVNGLFKTVNVGWNLDAFKVCPQYDDYIYAYNRLVGPITKEFNPQFIIVIAQFDFTFGDPQGDIYIKPEVYQYIIEKLSQICPQIVVLSQQSKNQKFSQECELAILKQLQGIPKVFSEQITPNQCGISAVTSGVDKHKEFWKSLETKELLEYQRQFLGINCDFISGGHIQSFKINGDQITKFTKKPEIDFYNKLNDKNDPYYLENQKILKFVPQFIFANYEESSITLENLIYGLENASILDLKIGYKTYDPKGNPLKREKAIQTAHKCQQITMGFRVAGVKIKDQNGDLIYDKNGTKADSEIKNHEQMKDIITKVFRSNNADCINQNALQDTMLFIQDLINAISESKRMFRSTSILILVDNLAQKHRIKWIDFCYVMELTEDIESPNELYDKNVVGGLKYLLELLKQII